MDAMVDAPMFPGRQREHVLGVPVDLLNWGGAIERIFGWADRRESRAVCVCDVHSIVYSFGDTVHADAIRSADMVTPDGAPVAWVLRRKGHDAQHRVSGPDLMWMCCRRAAETGTPIFLYGSTPTTLLCLEQKLHLKFPGINIVGALSPPFRRLSAAEDAAIVERINASGARIVWVGLGCPKQEAWMRSHRHRVRAVMVGVGAALDFHAGVVKRAPLWMQRSGLEWVHRIVQDPRRLAKRYLISNTAFIMACCGTRWSQGRVSDA
jgi:N-acetylglucosaminyldiphosphoundecaprenol N-acetyl-beta-D-mannosaminyltransferase